MAQPMIMERTHYIFVDFENVHEVNLSLIAGKPVKVILVLGKKHTSLPVELVKQLLLFPAQVRMIETGLTGRNALDFVLAYEVGVQCVADPEGSFHILSRDTGFDALVLHLRNIPVPAARHEHFARIPVLAGAAQPAAGPAARVPGSAKKTKKSEAIASLDARVKVMTERLAKNQKHRPKRKKTLLSHINDYFSKELTPNELAAILDELVAGKVIGITPAGAVVYHI